MPELSPAAAILAAFRERYDETLRPGPFVGRWQAKCLAEALDALADQAGSAKHWHVDQLRAIAAELEGADG